MSLATQIASAIELAQFHQLNDLSRDLWKAYGAECLTEDEAQELAEAIEAKKPKRTCPTAARAGVDEPSSFKPVKAPRPCQRSPDKQASIDRRRELARQSPVPPEHVHKFTLSEHAAMTILVGEVGKHGVCSLCMAAIAALAGTCRTVVRNTINKGRALGLLYRKERRRCGQKSLTNLVRILRPSWQHWLNWIGRRKTGTTKDKDSKYGAADRIERSGDGFAGDPQWRACV
jgi:hypothetical protein